MTFNADQHSERDEEGSVLFADTRVDCSGCHLLAILFMLSRWEDVTMRGHNGLSSLIVIVVFSLTASSCRHEEPSKEPSHSHNGDQVTFVLSDCELAALVGNESVKYAKRRLGRLGVTEPVRVDDAAGYLDGGSRDLSLVDANGIRFHFRIWCRPDGPMDIMRGSKDARTRRAELGGPEEQDLYGILVRWILVHPRRDALLEIGIDQIDYAKDRVLFDAWQFYHRIRRRLVPSDVTQMLPKPIDRSWNEGAMSVSSIEKASETRTLVRGSWHDASPSHRIRYILWWITDVDQTLRYQRIRPLESFTDEIGGSSPPAAKRYRIACDYEIWGDGDSGKAQLLAKNSVLSDWYKSAIAEEKKEGR